jgi:hypothetical protein
MSSLFAGYLFSTSNEMRVRGFSRNAFGTDPTQQRALPIAAVVDARVFRTGQKSPSPMHRTCWLINFPSRLNSGSENRNLETGAQGQRSCA